jgi:probable HAF family extracellular repeat protein
LNDHGHIVGVRSGIDDGSSRAFLYPGGASKDLGVLLPSHTSSAATAINNAGQIVGVSSQSWVSGIDEHAFIYEGGRMSDLNAHIPANYGWVLKEATDINVDGQIVGRGTLNGRGRGLVLTPTSPPCCSQSRTPRKHSRSTLSHRPPIL